jgi:CRISPR/Cas system endoribonuclease Cas6 (RAMP superfamily)
MGGWLTAGFPRTVLAACGQIRLGTVGCAVTDLALRPARRMPDLLTRPALTQPPSPSGPPTYFSQNGAHVVVPESRLVVDSWRRRWNASLFQDEELMISEELWRDLHLALTLARFKLGTDSRDLGHGRTRAWFTGTATLRLSKDSPADAHQAFGALVRFADFCGTGAQTAHGFGATSALSSTEDRHPYDTTSKARAVADAR